MKTRSVLHKVSIVFVYLMLFAGIGWAGVALAQAESAQAPQSDNPVFLPLVVGKPAEDPLGQATPTPTATTALNQPTPTATATTAPDQSTATATTVPDQPTLTPTATTQPTVAPVAPALFLETNWRTSSASIQVDQNGGMHVAYYYYEAMHDGAPNWAVYASCTSQCEKSEAWQRVNLAEDRDVVEVQLALTNAGQPRMLIRVESNVFTGGRDYLYAACDQNCTSSVGWQVGYMLTTDGTAIFDVNDDNAPQHSFALDPQDRPRFVFQDRNYAHAEPDLYGGYYAWCDADCTAGTPENPTWSRMRFTDEYRGGFQYEFELIGFPSLTFTSRGEPRFLAEFYPTNQSGEPSGIFYFGCDSGCDQRENWQRIFLIDRGSGTNVSWDLELDRQDRPRFAFFKGAGEVAGDKLLYIWCNENCFDWDKKGEQWFYNEPGVPTPNGKHPDLELDSQDRPHIAYADADDGGLGYVWCSANCETDNPTYQHKLIESVQLLSDLWPVAIPPHCTGGLWHGITPTLALDGANKPHVAYDTTYHAQCLYDDPSDGQPPFSAFHLIVRAVRATVFALP